MNLTQHLEEIERRFRNKFGQFYVSIDAKTKAIRIVDIVNGVKANSDDGTQIEFVTSGDIEEFICIQIHLARADERKQAYEDGKNAACDFIENHCITSRHPFEHMREVNIGVINEARNLK